MMQLLFVRFTLAWLKRAELKDINIKFSILQMLKLTVELMMNESVYVLLSLVKKVLAQIFAMQARFESSIGLGNLDCFFGCFSHLFLDGFQTKLDCF
jgi:hypothetical protein